MIDMDRVASNNRGFMSYGDPILCEYGTALNIRDSSCAEGPHMWLSLIDTDKVSRVSMHLDYVQVMALVAKCQAWLDDRLEDHES